MKRQAEADLPTRLGNFKIIAYALSDKEKMPHLALVHENINPKNPVLVRVHSECMTGDTFGSVRCDCGEQLNKAMEIAAEKGGVIVYLRQEGRGIGLINKLKAYTLQDEGLNTIDANTHLGFEADARQYDIAIEILKDLGITAIHLLTNNPLKIKALEDSDIRIVSRIPLVVAPHLENTSYLRTKQDLMGHLFK